MWQIGVPFKQRDGKKGASSGWTNDGNPPLLVEALDKGTFSKRESHLFWS